MTSISKLLWENIDKLRRKERKTKQEVHLFDEKGVQLTDKEERKSLVSFWKGVYQRHDNKIAKIWRKEEDKYKEKYEQEEKERVMMVDGTLHPVHLQEHLDMVTKVDRHMLGMEELKISETKVQQCVKRMKSKAAPGPDGLKI